MKLKQTTIMVDNQEKALQFYTSILGFVKKQDIPMGNFKWLTVASPEAPDDIELLLEPNGNPAASSYQKELFKQGIPATTFEVADIQQEYERMSALGVNFSVAPLQSGQAIIAVFNDNCGNLIQIYQA